MLQPRSYPELMGKALVFEPEPFLEMVDDDNPWVEGLFLVTCVGLAAGAANFLGGLLTAASLPDPASVRFALLQAVEQWAPLVAPNASPTQLESIAGDVWNWIAGFSGYQGGLIRLAYALLIPIGLVVQWLFLGVIAHVAGRALGGSGTLVETLGATALAAAPSLLLCLTLIPFVSVSWVLLTGWTILITYRAVEVVHDLTWQRATAAVLAAPVLLLLLGLVFTTLGSLFVGLGAMQ